MALLHFVLLVVFCFDSAFAFILFVSFHFPLFLFIYVSVFREVGVSSCFVVAYSLVGRVVGEGV